LAEIAAAHHATPRQAALRFLVRRASLFAIPKASTPVHAAENAGAGELQLTEAELARIDSAFPLSPRPKTLPTLWAHRPSSRFPSLLPWRSGTMLSAPPKQGMTDPCKALAALVSAEGLGGGSRDWGCTPTDHETFEDLARCGVLRIPRMSKSKIPTDLQLWITARQRYRLSHAQVQMARELGMNPRKLGKLANHKQEPWKLPLPQFIEELYLRRFGRPAPEEILSIEQLARRRAEKKAKRKAAKAARKESGESPEVPF
jgi:hypothetical protein